MAVATSPGALLTADLLGSSVYSRPVTPSLRGVVALVAAAVIVALVPSASWSALSASADRKGNRLAYSDPCSYLTTKQVQQQFGGPVTVDPTNLGTNGLVKAFGCAFIVGPPTKPVGVIVTTIQFPFFTPTGQTSVDVIEILRAVDAQGGLTVEDAKLGKASYVDVDRSMLFVAANKKFAFAIQWRPTGAPSEGGKLDPQAQKKLTALAKAIVARAR